MNETIHVVSGLPRSGTSMMMRVLDAGGLPLLTDGVRAADDDNPQGYFEFEGVKRTAFDTRWLPDAKGKAVKVIAQLLADLPSGPRYKVIFMRRALEEILISQRKMLKRRGVPVGPSDDEMRRLLLAHQVQVEDWLSQRPDLPVLFVSYNRMMATPDAEVERINRFLGGTLSVPWMSAAIDTRLYRNRAR